MKRSASDVAVDTAAGAKRPATSVPHSLPSLTPPVPSFDEMLARQLPYLVRVDPTTPCSLREARHPRRTDLTLKLLDPEAAGGDAEPVLVDLRTTSPPTTFSDDATIVRLEFHPELQCPSNTYPYDPTILAVMSFTQLLHLIGLPTELVPPALLQRVRISDVIARITVDATTGTALCISGTAHCGPGIRDCLTFFNRLAPRSSVCATAPTASDYEVSTSRLLHSPINRWLTLQCRPVLDSAVFPQLATLTQGRCVEPLYQYVLCETEGGVELSDAKRQEFERGQYLTFDRWHSIHALRLRPTNAVFAIQPHLPSGYLELSTSALTGIAVPSTSADLAEPCVTTSAFCPTALPARPSRLVLDLEQCPVDVLYECLSYLDTNSLLFGLLPAVHSLPSVTATVADSTYARGVLLSRFGAVSDAGLWSDELLVEWRREGYEKQRAEIRKRYEKYAADRKERAVAKACEQANREEQRAHRLEVHWAAVMELQTRINKYLIRVMLQRKEQVLPQLYQLPQHQPQPPVMEVSAPAVPGTARPVYLTVPDAAMELLMCVPPFHPLPVCAGHNDIATDRECSLDGTINNASPHHVDFAAVMSCPDPRIVSDPSFSSDFSSCAVYALYMGPVYVYENEYAAEKGRVVDMTELLTLSDELGQPIIPHDADRLRVVRQLFIDDVNQLPVICRMPYCDDYGDINPFAHTLRACFGSKGVARLIAETRESWRSQQADKDGTGATQHGDSDCRVAEEQGEGVAGPEHGEEVGEGEEEEELDDEDGEGEGEDDEGADQYYIRLTDRVGAKLEFVYPLMDELFKTLHVAMHEDESWTTEVASRAAAATAISVSEAV